MLTVPASFVKFTLELHGEKGREWLARLPTILVACEQRWHVVVGEPFPNISYHFVVPGIRTDGTPVVLKFHSPTDEFEQELTALRLFDGSGMVRVLAYDMADEVMLLERLRPGTSLRNVRDDEQAISIAVTVMRQLWHPASSVASIPTTHRLPTVEKWGQGFVRLRERYQGGNDPFPKALLEEAEKLYTELSATMTTPVLLHGDLHQDNILSSERDNWLAIDPKGLIGEPAYETGAMLRNFFPDLLEMPHPKQILARRVDQFAAELGFDRARIRGWGLSQAVLSAWWSVEDSEDGEDGDQLNTNTLQCAQWLSEL